MINFLSSHATIIGLLFFFIFFISLIIWTFRPSAKKDYNKSSYIPFEENE